MKWNAQGYDIVSTVQEKWGRGVIEALPLQGNERVMDAGCGSGRVTAILLERLPSGFLYAVDKSQAMIDQAKVRLAAYTDRTEFIFSDLSLVTLPRRVDVVFSNAVFHWILDHAKLFRNLGRSMRVGGIFHTQCGGKGNLAQTKKIADRICELPEYERFLRGWQYPTYFAGPEETAQRMVSAGFDDVHADLVEAPTDFDSREDFALFVQNVVLLPYLSRLPDEETKESFLSAFVDQVDEMFSGRFWLDYVRLNIRGIKK